MSYIASTIRTVPSSGFEWYIVFLEGQGMHMDDPVDKGITEEIENIFVPLGHESDEKIVLVQGFDKVRFRKSFEEQPFFNRIETPAFYGNDNPWPTRARFPSIFITNNNPVGVLTEKAKLDQAKVMLFPLRDIYLRYGTIKYFYQRSFRV